VICRTKKEDGIPLCIDAKALDVGKPVFDVDQGGSYDLEDVSVERNNGILYAVFFFGDIFFGVVRK
jgi:hypothetical protein